MCLNEAKMEEEEEDCCYMGGLMGDDEYDDECFEMAAPSRERR